MKSSTRKTLLLLLALVALCASVALCACEDDAPQPKDYTVTLDYNGATGGNKIKTLTVTLGQAIGELPAPAKDGVEFIGWKLNDGLVTAETVWQTDGDATLVAQWLAPTEGLEYGLNPDGKSYSVIGIGHATDTVVVIPSTYDGLPVKSINRYAFQFCTSFTEIVIPSIVTSIGDYAFYDCFNLTEITIPKGVKSIGFSVFSGCAKLATIRWNATECTVAQSYEKDAIFSRCFNLTTVIFANSVVTIPAYTFDGCANLKNVTFGEESQLTSIGEYAFLDCTSLTEITIPQNVKSIDNVAFGNCASLTEITIPASVTNIGYGVFSMCSSLKRIIVDSNNRFYHSKGNCLIETATKTLVSGCKNSIIPTDGSVTSIKTWAFVACASLTEIAIPKSVTNIELEAFSQCTSLVNITFAEESHLTSIGEYAFIGCTSLASIKIPSSVISIDGGVFSGCSSLTIYCEAASKPDGWRESWNGGCPVVWDCNNK